MININNFLFIINLYKIWKTFAANIPYSFLNTNITTYIIETQTSQMMNLGFTIVFEPVQYGMMNYLIYKNLNPVLELLLYF